MKIYVNKGNYGWQTRAVNGDDKMYIDVQFKKGQEPQETFLQIKINDGFFSMYKTKTGLAKPKLVVMDYEKMSKEEYVPNDEEVMSADELPF